MIPEKWVEKHIKENKYYFKKNRKIPGPSSYRPMSAGTFDRKSFDAAVDKKKRTKSLNKGFGTDAKFEYTR